MAKILDKSMLFIFEKGDRTNTDYHPIEIKYFNMPEAAIPLMKN